MIDGDYIKAEAQAGRMGQALFAIVIKKAGAEFEFRSPTNEDRAAIAAAETELLRKRPDWLAREIHPRRRYWHLQL